jgi:anthranilate/para-aminobenzoate synthase component I
VSPIPYIRLDGSARDGRWRLPSRHARYQLRCDAEGRGATLHVEAVPIRRWADPLAALHWMAHEFTTEPGRWVGFLGYDLGRLFESVPSASRDDLALPLFAFGFIADDAPDVDFTPEHVVGRDAPLTSSFMRPRYLDAAARAIEYIAAGDVFQINLSQRFTTGLPARPLDVYQRLLHQAPAAYGGLLDFGDFALICNSPELFLRVTPDRRVVTRPIKGTRPRRPGMDAELRDSIKDQAELNMIVDLERNDLGRVCEIGSVKVTEPRVIEAHPTVYHGVATIEGLLRPDVSFVDLLRATFPGGSITGAPKIRAMEIIDELEPVRRGPYCGAIGYVASDGSIEFNIAIRTMIAKNGLVHVPVGGGIVADSEPEAEYEETLVKARAMFAALGLSVDDVRGT